MLLSERDLKKWGNLDLNQGPAGYESAVSPFISAVIYCSQQYDSKTLAKVQRVIAGFI